MNATKLIIAAGFAIASTGAFAETGVSTYQIDNVANVYGRASVPNVKIIGAVAAQSGNVADSGRDTTQGDTKVAVTADKEAAEFGRS
jgi:hypothetical protein